MNLTQTFLLFIIAYPGVMATLWISGGLYYFFHWERKQQRQTDCATNPNAPRVTVLVPCHNEGQNIKETIGHLSRQHYLNLEIIAINDGSRDNTGVLLDKMMKQYSNLKVLHQENQGKASAMNHGLAEATGDIIVGIDGDSVLDYEAVSWMVEHFLIGPRVGGVTGNPRVRTRSTAVGKIQTGEFSSIIGLIKRAQRVYGMVFTVSGVICAFRKQALLQVGGWSTDMITEDIDISWKLQLSGWQIRYEPHALCWVLMPETLRGLFKQRLRWAQGGAEAFLRYFPLAIRWRNRRFWLLLLEYILSGFWCYSLCALAILGVVQWALNDIVLHSVTTIILWSSSWLIPICLLQFAVSFFLDKRYDQDMGRHFFWSIWYPFFYWMLNLLTTVIAIPKAVTRRRGQLAIWRSPDRGEALRGH
ncbi:poly-beta-1,6 N-acetyl-D-glucosamine synthase [Pistricoccus aurantiacus]|uniref:Poly-beta-1,6-N-acetyl-D-glucosamine synthase n=1 Tax=Pistricoccus aurantiacus TaxID=1883414 RepID=A0A5B8SQ09_9GAMM|nr:poly-beta-1,6-N-acetyl-D-glucosamine synthase [Pistricoccus aurantiacus]QEA38097.1 poly-beta-1,6 N-acetyl-D-glucosamine synthase [Pistricoccus aurantiacus]